MKTSISVEAEASESFGLKVKKPIECFLQVTGRRCEIARNEVSRKLFAKLQPVVLNALKIDEMSHFYLNEFDHHLQLLLRI